MWVLISIIFVSASIFVQFITQSLVYFISFSDLLLQVCHFAFETSSILLFCI